MDDLIADFTAITSADPERAAQYLHLTDNNLEQAIQLFFDSPNLDLSGSAATHAPSASAPQPPPSARPQYAEDDDGVIRIDSDDEDPEFFGNQAQAPPRPAPAAAAQPTFSNTAEDDEAMARRLQEEMYGGADQTADFGVRAPMARTTETLIGPSANWGSNSDDMSAAIAEQMRARERRVLGKVVEPLYAFISTDCSLLQAGRGSSINDHLLLFGMRTTTRTLVVRPCLAQPAALPIPQPSPTTSQSYFDLHSS